MRWTKTRKWSSHFFLITFNFLSFFFFRRSIESCLLKVKFFTDERRVFEKLDNGHFLWSLLKKKGEPSPSLPSLFLHVYFRFSQNMSKTRGFLVQRREAPFEATSRQMKNMMPGKCLRQWRQATPSPLFESVKALISDSMECKNIQKKVYLFSNYLT